MELVVVLELEVHLQTLRLLEMLVFVFEKERKWSPKNVNPVLEFWKLLISHPHSHTKISLKNLLVYNEC